MSSEIEYNPFDHNGKQYPPIRATDPHELIQKAWEIYGDQVTLWVFRWYDKTPIK